MLPGRVGAEEAMIVLAAIMKEGYLFKRWRGIR